MHPLPLLSYRFLKGMEFALFISTTCSSAQSLARSGDAHGDRSGVIMSRLCWLDVFVPRKESIRGLWGETRQQRSQTFNLWTSVIIRFIVPLTAALITLQSYLMEHAGPKNSAKAPPAFPLTHHGQVELAVKDANSTPPPFLTPPNPPWNPSLSYEIVDWKELGSVSLHGDALCRARMRTSISRLNPPSRSSLLCSPWTLTETCHCPFSQSVGGKDP